MNIKACKTSNGFTLVELSIVLVIIGLIVGGVLVGQDLIKSAEIRATISQYEKYNSAVHTFQTKYNGIPGDLKYTDAQAFGLFSNGMDGTPAKGDGNGLLQSAWGIVQPNSPSPYNEVLVFWRHLSDAGTIDGGYGSNLASGGTLSSDQSVSQQSLLMPPSKIGNGSFAVYSTNGQNYFQIYTGFDISGVSLYTGRPSWYNHTPSITPIQARAIDYKIDDGLPSSGNIQAVSGNTTIYFGRSVLVSDHCTTGASPDTYDIGTTYQNSINCDLSMKFQ